MKGSTTPFLLLVLIALIALATRSASHRGRVTGGEARSIYVLLGVLGSWGVVTSTLAIADVYSSPTFLALLPGLWLPLFPFILTFAGMLFFPRLRSGLRTVLAETPWHRQIYVHAIRVLAIGTFIKVIAGEFPAYFALLVGIPDLLFGASAFFFGRYASHRPPSRRALITWNLAGIAAVLPAPLLIQMGLPGPLQVFTGSPTGERLFDFPMVLAPTIVVPIFLLLNMAALWRVFETRPVKGATP